jgi:hypothetical protein
MTTQLTWRTSSFSAPNNDCVELAHGATETNVRDTKHREGGTLRFQPTTFAFFLDAVKD